MEECLCNGTPCKDRKCNEERCGFCKGVIDLLASHDRDAISRIERYEALLARAEESTNTRIERSEQRIDKMMDVVSKMNDYMARIEKPHEQIKNDEDKYVENLRSQFREILTQNTTMLNMIERFTTPHHGTNVNINK